MNGQEWVPIRKAAEFYGVSKNTLRNWDRDNKIQVKWTKAGQRRFLLQNNELIKNRKKICYCRVSSNKQKNDLQRQIEFMRNKFDKHEIWYDIGSGINWKRPKFNKILELAKDGLVEEVVVAHRDRMCRFAFELVEHILELHQVKLLVLNNEEHSDEREISEDILSILQVYICKQNGKRRYSSKPNNNKENRKTKK